MRGRSRGHAADLGNGPVKSVSKSSRKRRVAVVTGTRAEYGLLHSTMTAITNRRDLQLQIVVTGMHLLRKFGHTVDEIEQDGWSIDARVKMQNGHGDPVDQAAGLSRGIVAMAKFLEESKTDIVVVLGDRIEAMAGALAAVTTGRFLAHIHGGDVAPGDIDDGLRNAITKLAHLHLTATEEAKKRVVKMGEKDQRVFVVGAPGLDHLGALTRKRRDASTRSGRVLVLHHPCGRSQACEGRVMSALLHAVDDVGLTPLIIYPNSDRGHTGIVKAIESFGRRHDKGSIQIVRSMKREQFLHALIDVDVLVGNSSSGIIESAAAGTPAVNVGARQQGRQRSGPSVLDATESRESIRTRLQHALRKRPIMGGPTAYGDGRAGVRIAEHLAKIPLTEAFRHKV